VGRAGRVPGFRVTFAARPYRITTSHVVRWPCPGSHLRTRAAVAEGDHPTNRAAHRRWGGLGTPHPTAAAFGDLDDLELVEPDEQISAVAVWIEQR
jgi:hypothetical protein